MTKIIQNIETTKCKCKRSRLHPTEPIGISGFYAPFYKTMEDNIINHPNGTIIINGGNPLPGCPENFDEANKWADNANGEKEDYEFPTWKFDCGFKLDFDGPILSISSRFYPLKTHYGPTWDGTVTVKILDKEVEEMKFDCKTLDELRSEVEKYADEVRQRVADIFKS